MRLNYLAASVMSLLPCIAYADIEWSATLGVGKAFTDNARLTESNTRSDSLNSLNASVDIGANERLYEIGAAYTFQKQDWQHDTFNADSELTGGGSAIFRLIPERFEWSITHAQIIARTESQLPNTPDNREERTIVSTGPQVRQRLSSRSELTFRSTYSTIDLEESSRNDSDRLSNALSIRYLTKFRAMSSFTASNEKVSFKENKNLNYQRETLFLGLEGTHSLFDYSFAAGANRINPKIGEEQSGKYVNLGFSKDYRNATVSLELNKELTDSVFGSGQIDTDAGFSDTLTSLGEVEIIDRESAYLSYGKDLVPNRFSAGIDVGYEAEKSKVGNSVDRERKVVVLNSDYALNRDLSLSCEIELAEDAFMSESPARKDETQRMTLGLAYLYGSSLNTRFEIEYRELTSDLEGFGYEEWSSLIRVEYLFDNR